MISPEALEKARSLVANYGSDPDGLLVGAIAAALQAERDAAVPKLPDDVAELVERLRDFGRAYQLNVFPEVTDGEREWLRTEHPGLQDRIAASMGRHFAEHAAEAVSTIQSLVARNAELEAGLKDTVEALRSRLTADELNALHHKPYEHPLSAYDRARSLLNKDRQP